MGKRLKFEEYFEKFQKSRYETEIIYDKKVNYFYYYYY